MIDQNTLGALTVEYKDRQSGETCQENLLDILRKGFYAEGYMINDEMARRMLDEIATYITENVMLGMGKDSHALHPTTKQLVVQFAYAMADKLALAQAKRGDGGALDWTNQYRVPAQRVALIEHIFKGDPRDVAAFCAFLWYHRTGTITEATQQALPDSHEDWMPGLIHHAEDLAIAALEDGACGRSMSGHDQTDRAERELVEYASLARLGAIYLTGDEARALSALADLARLAYTAMDNAVSQPDGTMSIGAEDAKAIEEAMTIIDRSGVPQPGFAAGGVANVLWTLRRLGTLQSDAARPTRMHNDEPVAYRHSHTAALHNTRDEVVLADADEQAQALFTRAGVALTEDQQEARARALADYLGQNAEDGRCVIDPFDAREIDAILKVIDNATTD